MPQPSSRSLRSQEWPGEGVSSSLSFTRINSSVYLEKDDLVLHGQIGHREPHAIGRAHEDLGKVPDGEYQGRADGIIVPARIANDAEANDQTCGDDEYCTVEVRSRLSKVAPGALQTYRRVQPGPRR